jgi:hypothetical protein
LRSLWGWRSSWRRWWSPWSCTQLTHQLPEMKITNKKNADYGWSPWSCTQLTHISFQRWKSQIRKIQTMDDLLDPAHSSHTSASRGGNHKE